MSRLHLFEAFGVELEYMIVDRASLSVRPIADRLLTEDGQVVSEVEHGPISWSNELVSHVVELKTTAPAPMEGLERMFAEHVREINQRLDADGCALMGSGTHPFFDPDTETEIWPHEYNEVYRTYDRIFGCRGHGWSNLQSAHLNLPFADDDEFGRLHAAVRIVLPIIPALAASTPFLDGATHGCLDARLDVYRRNQARVPELAGKVIPEPVFSEAEYEDRIYSPIMRGLEPHDPERVLQKHFANSRGAIARFDRGSIEIRLIDLQECPTADIGVLALIAAAVRALTEERWASARDQRRWHEDELVPILDGCIRDAEHHVIADERYLEGLGLDGGPRAAGAVWRHLLESLGPALTDPHAMAIEHIVRAGTLASRLRAAAEAPGAAAGDRPAGAPPAGRVRDAYARLIACLERDRQLGS